MTQGKLVRSDESVQEVQGLRGVRNIQLKIRAWVLAGEPTGGRWRVIPSQITAETARVAELIKEEDVA